MLLPSASEHYLLLLPFAYKHMLLFYEYGPMNWGTIETNLMLQGDELNLIKTKSIISAFVAKLILYKQNIGINEFSQFLNFSKIKINDDDMLTYSAFKISSFRYDSKISRRS